jgi:hypothetical protein
MSGQSIFDTNSFASHRQIFVPTAINTPFTCPRTCEPSDDNQYVDITRSPAVGSDFVHTSTPASFDGRADVALTTRADAAGSTGADAAGSTGIEVAGSTGTETKSDDDGCFGEWQPTVTAPYKPTSTRANLWRLPVATKFRAIPRRSNA